MAVNSYSPVEFSSDGRPIISSKNALMKCPDGSIHRVPVINCNALKFLQRNYDDDETSSGEEEEAAHASPRASDGANRLEEQGYRHAVVIHKDEFVNKEGYHTNSVESIWSQFKTWT